MTQGSTTGHEAWLRLTCLAVSVGLHVGLGAMSWHSFESAAFDAGPMIVALVDRSEAAPMKTGLPTPAPLRARSAPPARRGVPAPAAVSARPPATSAQLANPSCAVPEAMLVADLVKPSAAGGDEGAAGAQVGEEAVAAGSPDSNAGGPADGSSAWGLERRGDQNGEGGSLIKATPRYEANPLPNYPRLARQSRWEGTVRLRARVTAGGTVEAVSLERSSGHAVLDRSALDGVLRWRFIPATRGGVPVPCEVSIPVAFRLTE